ncbi:hypothetical protein DRQ05_06030, partial [bacterium]
MKIFSKRWSVASKIFLVVIAINLIISTVVLMTVLNSTRTEMRDVLKEHLTIDSNNIDTLTEEALASVRWRAEIAWIVLALSSSFLLYLFIYYVLKKPIGQLLNAGRKLVANAGDLRADVNINSNDELGLLGSSLNDMFSDLTEIIRVIRTTADKVNFSAQSLSASTEQMNSITEETSMTVQNIAKASDLQAQKVEEMIRE